jgi:hypothetical protein
VTPGEIAKAALGIMLGAASKAVVSALEGKSLEESVKDAIEHAESKLAEKEIPGFHDVTDAG